MKVKAIKNYYDKQLKKDVKAGEEFEVNEERANILVSAKVCEIVATPTTTEKVAKKPRAKKEA